MRAFPIVNHLRKILPTNTDKVTTNVVISNLTNVGVTVTVTTATAHGLLVGNGVVIRDTKVKTPVSALTSVGLIASMLTAADHDQTLNIIDTRPVNVIIEGADQSEYNGTLPLASTINRRNLTYTMLTDPAIDTATGTIFLIEDRLDGYNGAFNITSVPTTTSFTYTLPSIPVGDADFTSGIVCVDMRILAAINLETAQNEYTRQNTDEYFVFVVLGDATASRSRTNTTDHSNTISQYSDKRLDFVRVVNIFVFAPSKNDLGGGVARDEMETFGLALFKSLYGFQPEQDTEGETNQVIAPTIHGVEEYSDSFYIHNFVFEAREDLTVEDSFQEATRAFRNARMITNNSNDEIIMNTDVDLDVVDL